MHACVLVCVYSMSSMGMCIYMSTFVGLFVAGVQFSLGLLVCVCTCMDVCLYIPVYFYTSWFSVM